MAAFKTSPYFAISLQLRSLAFEDLRKESWLFMELLCMVNEDYVYISEASLQRISIYIYMDCREFIQCFLACDKDKGSDDKEKCTPELWASS